jgi:hypothetical protein
LAAFENRAKAERNPSQVRDLPDLNGSACSSFSWRTSAVLIYRNWLYQIMESKLTHDVISLKCAGSR